MFLCCITMTLIPSLYGTDMFQKHLKAFHSCVDDNKLQIASKWSPNVFWESLPLKLQCRPMNSLCNSLIQVYKAAQMNLGFPRARGFIKSFTAGLVSKTREINGCVFDCPTHRLPLKLPRPRWAARPIRRMLRDMHELVDQSRISQSVNESEQVLFSRYCL